MSPDDIYSQLSLTEDLIQLEKARGFLHDSVPSSIDPTPKPSLESRRLMADILGQRGERATPYQGTTPDWTASEAIKKQQEAMRQIAQDTIVKRTQEQIVAPSGYDTSAPQQELLRQRTNTLDSLRATNQARGVPEFGGGGRPASVDNGAAMRTPNTSGLKAPTQATTPPRSASPSTWQQAAPTIAPEISTPLNLPKPIGTRPAGLPQSIGLPRGTLTGSAIGAGLDFGLRLASGQNAGAAATAAAGGFAGSLIGSSLGAVVGGPIGAYVGGFIGGYIGGSLGSALGNSLFPPAIGRSPDSLTGFPIPPDNPSFVGGGQAGYYDVSYRIVITNKNPSIPPVVYAATLPILGSIKDINVTQVGGTDYRVVIVGGSATNKDAFVDNQILYDSNGIPNGNNRPQAWITNLSPRSGQPDTGAAQSRQYIAPNNRFVYPGTGSPHPSNSPTTNYTPNSTPTAGGSPTGDTPHWVPTATRPAPKGTPAGEAPIGSSLPNAQPTRLPDTQRPESNNPSSRAVGPPLREGRLGQEGQYGESFGQYQDRTMNASGGKLAGDMSPLIDRALPTAVLGTFFLAPQITGLRPGPTPETPTGTGNPSAPQPEPQTQPQTQTPSGVGTGSGTQTDFCRFHEDTVSHTKLDQQFTKLELMEMFQTAFQANMDRKLGPEIPNGGIGGKLGRMASLASKTWNFLQVDRALAVFTWIGVLHNAYMLSNNLGQTLFSAISNVLDAVGIQKVDDDGNEEPYDIGEIVAKYTDNFAKGVFGTTTWEGIKADWKKLNRIYQAATNLLNSLQSMTYAMLEGLETVGNYVAKIGNAARIFGVFTEKAFNPMRDNLNFKGGRFFRFLERSEEFVQNIDSIASSVVDIQQTAADCSDQKAELTKSIQDFEKSQTKEEEKKKKDSASPPITPADEQKPQS